MEKYKAFLAATKRLEENVSKMETATTREELELLQMDIKKCFGTMMVKLPYVQTEIQNYALEHVSRVGRSDAEAALK